MPDPDTDENISGQVLLFGIGAQKAGTTWLQNQLQSQDGVFLAKPKELHYWDCIRAPYFEQFRLQARKRLVVPGPGDRWRYRLSKYWRRALRARIELADRYEAIYRSAPDSHAAYLDYMGVGQKGSHLVGDITPSYALLGRETFSEMLSCASAVRFVFIMRDPIARLWSGLHQHYRSDMSMGRVSDAALLSRFTSICKSPSDPHFLRSDYPKTIIELDAAVPQTHIHYCFFETLLDHNNGVKERAELASFLGVKPSTFNAQKKVHENKSVKPIPSAERSIARTAMNDIYAQLEDKFESRLPDAWAL